ncbi:putative reverse transcriptase domain-containing protein [Tanacetum coccineum]
MNNNNNNGNNNNTGNNNNGNGGNNGCSYKGFQACGPKEYDGKRGAIALTYWIKKMENVLDNSGSRGRKAAIGMTWNDFKALLGGRNLSPSNEMERLNRAPGQAGNPLVLEGNRNNRNNGNQTRGRAYNVNVNAAEASRDPKVVMWDRMVVLNNGYVNRMGGGSGKVVEIPLIGVRYLGYKESVRWEGYCQDCRRGDKLSFRIALNTGAMPVAKSPYRLAPSKMQELSGTPCGIPLRCMIFGGVTIAFMGIEAANGTPWTEVRKWITEEFCPRSVLQRLEQELYNLKLKGTDIDGYTNRFHELALLCPRMVEPEQVKVEQYIRGLSKNIRGDVTSSRPTSIDEAVRMAYQLMGQIIHDKTEVVSEGEKRKGEGDRGGRGDNRRDYNRR